MIEHRLCYIAVRDLYDEVAYSNSGITAGLRRSGALNPNSQHKNIVVHTLAVF